MNIRDYIAVSYTVSWLALSGVVLGAARIALYFERRRRFSAAKKVPPTHQG